MHERFSDRARRALALANLEAIQLHHENLSPTHVLLGLLNVGGSVGVLALHNLDVDIEAMRADLAKRVEPGNKELHQAKLAQSAETRQVILFAIEEAR